MEYPKKKLKLPDSDLITESEIKDFSDSYLITDTKELKRTAKKLIKELEHKKNYCTIPKKITEIEHLLSTISAYLHTFFQNEGFINISEYRIQLYEASRFTIEDSQSAIDTYKSSNYNTPNYLMYYGLLQAFHSQQDALKGLYEVIYSKNVRDVLTIFPNFEKIRTIRNKILHSVQSPVKKEKDKIYRNYRINQSSMTKNIFEIFESENIFFYPKKDDVFRVDDISRKSKFEEISLYELIELQETQTINELKFFIEVLKECNTFQELKEKCPDQI